MSSTTLSGLNLSNLPPLEPPRDVFDQVMAESRRGRRRLPRWLPLSAAAAALVTLGVIVGLTVQVQTRERQLAEWIAYSQELETQLHRFQNRSQVMHGHRAAAASTLASEVAQIDWALAQRPAGENELRLWQTRAGLLNQLVSVHASGHWLNQPQAGTPIVTPGLPNKLAASEI